MKNTLTFYIIFAFCFIQLKAQIVSTFLDSDGIPLEVLTIDENFLYVIASSATSTDKVFRKNINSTDNNYEIFDLSNAGFQGICKIGDYVYVSKTANSSPGIRRFNINDEPITIEEFISINKVMGLANRGSELYFSSDNKIYKVDVNDTNLTFLQIATISGSDSWGSIGLKVYDNYLYIPETTGISRINLDTNQKEIISPYTGESLVRGSDEDTFYLTGGEDYSAIYELDVQTQTYSLLVQIEGFIGTYDIVFADNSLFVTTMEGDYNKVARINLNALSTEDLQQNYISIYPNPASDIINVVGFEPNEIMTIINPNGQIIKSIKLENNKINISDLKPGVYFLKSENIYNRFIKK